MKINKNKNNLNNYKIGMKQYVIVKKIVHKKLKYFMRK